MPKIYEKKIKQNCRPGSVYIPIKETSETLKPITCYQSIIVACHNAKKKKKEKSLFCIIAQQTLKILCKEWFKRHHEAIVEEKKSKVQ